VDILTTGVSGERLVMRTVCRRLTAREKAERPLMRHGTRSFSRPAIVGRTSTVRA